MFSQENLSWTPHYRAQLNKRTAGGDEKIWRQRPIFFPCLFHFFTLWYKVYIATHQSQYEKRPIDREQPDLDPGD
jgi:hypothetical protein